MHKNGLFCKQEKLQRGNEINSLRKQIEKEFLEKGKLEDDIMEVIRNQLTFDKAAQYTDRITKKCRMITKDLVCSICFHMFKIVYLKFYKLQI